MKGTDGKQFYSVWRRIRSNRIENVFLFMLCKMEDALKKMATHCPLCVPMSKEKLSKQGHLPVSITVHSATLGCSCESATFGPEPEPPRTPPSPKSLVTDDGVAGV